MKKQKKFSPKMIGGILVGQLILVIGTMIICDSNLKWYIEILLWAIIILSSSFFIDLEINDWIKENFYKEKKE